MDCTITVHALLGCLLDACFRARKFGDIRGRIVPIHFRQKRHPSQRTTAQASGMVLLEGRKLIWGFLLTEE